MTTAPATISAPADPFSEESILQFAYRRPDLSPDLVAVEYVALLRPDHLATFARRHVQQHVARQRRQVALRIEQAAQIAANIHAERERREAEEAARREAWERERPARKARERAEQAERREQRERDKLQAAARLQSRREWLRDHPYPQGSGYVSDREAQGIAAFCAEFRTWMGDQFDGWYSNALARLTEAATTRQGQRNLANFRADWEGIERPEWTLAGAINDAMLDHADQIRLEVTEELLSSMFALGDGKRVSWGEATIQQHEQRIELLTKIAAGNLETASRHRVAIRMIEEQAGATCLGEVAA